LGDVVILLDTHIWVWWVHGDARLTPSQSQHLRDNERAGLGVSVISCWEVAKLVEVGRLVLPLPLGTWMGQALAYPGIRLLELTPPIAIESTTLPPPFHRDPADQMIVATARVHDIPLLTADGRILAYPHVRTLT
jgi:PIN domain nuclease of toxin-antitoxin system